MYWYHSDVHTDRRCKIVTDTACDDGRLEGKFAESFFDSAFDPQLSAAHKSYMPKTSWV